MPRTFHVYILASRSRTLYIGVTGALHKRIAQHRAGLGSGFARRYAALRLVYAESFAQPSDAIAREKQLKGWRRERKVALIASANPGWDDWMAEG
jgi:putative endonuclease